MEGNLDEWVYTWMDGWKLGRMDANLGGQMQPHIEGWMEAWIDGRINGRMDRKYGKMEVDKNLLGWMD